MSLLTLFSPTTWGVLVVGLALYSAILFDKGRDYETWRRERATIALNNKLEDVSQRETDLKVKADELRVAALAKAVGVTTPGGPGCKATKAEAEALSRIR